MPDYLRAIWRNNPVRTASILAAALIAVAAKFNVILDEADATDIVAIVGLILGGGQVVRSQVTPWQGEIGPASDDLLQHPDSDGLRAGEWTATPTGQVAGDDVDDVFGSQTGPAPG
jgi:hypothetical protein